MLAIRWNDLSSNFHISGDLQERRRYNIFFFFINERYHKRVPKQSSAKYSAERRDNFLPKFTRSRLSIGEFTRAKNSHYDLSTIECSDRGTLDKPRYVSGNLWWRNQQDNRDVAIEGDVTRNSTEISSSFFFAVKSTSTKEEKRIWQASAWERWEIRNIRCRIDAWLNTVIYRHCRWERGKGFTIMKRHPMQYEQNRPKITETFIR